MCSTVSWLFTFRDVNSLEKPPSILTYLQIALEDARAVCRQLKAELADGQRREAVLVEERDDQEAQKRSLQAALVDARARGLEADLKGTGLPRYAHFAPLLQGFNSTIFRE